MQTIDASQTSIIRTFGVILFIYGFNVFNKTNNLKPLRLILKTLTFIYNIWFM